MISDIVSHTVNQIHPSDFRREFKDPFRNSCVLTGKGSTSQPQKSRSSARRSDVPYRKGFSKERVVINIRGVKYETQLGTLHRFPDSLLGDPKKRSKYYDKGRCEYFFDRDRDCFDAILFFYQSNGMILQRPEGVPISVFIGDVKFFELGEDVFEHLKLSESILLDETKIAPENRYLKQIWLLFEYSDSSKAAKYISRFTFFATVVSVAAMCAETLPSNKYYKHLNMSENRRVEAIMENDFTKIDDPIFIVRTLCNVWFVLEYLVRLASCPRKVQFLKSFINIINILALIPYFITLQLALMEVSTVKYIGTRIEMLRVFRLLHLRQKSIFMVILVESYWQSLDGLFSLVSVLGIAVTTFSTALYLAEHHSPMSDFYSIPSGFTFTMETITTVGAGGKTVRTLGSMFVLSVCSITGVLIITLFIPFISTNFINLYTRNVHEIAAIKAAEFPEKETKPDAPHYNVY